MNTTNFRRWTLMVAFLFCCLPILQAENLSANAILGKMREAALSKPSIEAFFTINGGEGAVHGSAVIVGSKFTLSTPQLNVWYNGKTQWTFLHSSGEVNISEPDATELMVSNPFSILSAHEKYYSLRRLKDNSGQYRVEMTPKSKDTTIDKIVVLIDAKTFLPSSIVVYFDDSRSISVVVNNINGGSKKPESTFNYDPKKYPAKEIIDLR